VSDLVQPGLQQADSIQVDFGGKAIYAPIMMSLREIYRQLVQLRVEDPLARQYEHPMQVRGSVAALRPGWTIVGLLTPENPLPTYIETAKELGRE